MHYHIYMDIFYNGPILAIDRANEFTKMYQKVKTLSWTKVNIHPSIFFFYSQVKLSKKMKEY